MANMSQSKKVAAVVVVLDDCGAFKKKQKNFKLWAKNWLLNIIRFTLELTEFYKK